MSHTDPQRNKSFIPLANVCFQAGPGEKSKPGCGNVVGMSLDGGMCGPSGGPLLLPHCIAGGHPHCGHDGGLLSAHFHLCAQISPTLATPFHFYGISPYSSFLKRHPRHCFELYSWAVLSESLLIGFEDYIGYWGLKPRSGTRSIAPQ